jgi:hypothetical protein
MPFETAPAEASSFWFVVVAHDQPALFAALVRRLGGDPAARVILDRRRGERRRAAQPRQPDRRLAERRRVLGIRQDLRFSWVAVCRAVHWGPPGDGDPVVSESREGGEARMSMTDAGVEVRQQVERWIEESQYLLGRVIPSVFDDNQRLRDKLAASEQDGDRMREEIAGLRREINELHGQLNALRGQHEYLRSEQATVAEALSRAVMHMSQMMQPINEMVAKLNVGQSMAMESSLQ